MLAIALRYVYTLIMKTEPSKEKIIIADDSCNGQEQEFAAFLRANGYENVSVEPALRSTDTGDMWDKFCRS